MEVMVMGMQCKCCTHSKRLDIDRAIVAGASQASIAREFGVSPDSVRRHRETCVSRQMLKAHEMKELVHSKSLADQLQWNINKARDILELAEKKEHLGTALRAIGELRCTYELMIRVAAYLQETQRVDQQQAFEERKQKIGRLSEDELILFSLLHRKIAGENVTIELPVKPFCSNPGEAKEPVPMRTKRPFKAVKESSQPISAPEEPETEPETWNSTEPQTKEITSQYRFLNPDKVFPGSGDSPGRINTLPLDIFSK
jgi:hypothetical protein